MKTFKMKKMKTANPYVAGLTVYDIPMESLAESVKREFALNQNVFDEMLFLSSTKEFGQIEDCTTRFAPIRDFFAEDSSSGRLEIKYTAVLGVYTIKKPFLQDLERIAKRQTNLLSKHGRRR